MWTFGVTCRGHLRLASCSRERRTLTASTRSSSTTRSRPGIRWKAEGFARALAVTADDLEYVAEALLNGVRTTPVSGARPAGVHGFHCEIIVQVRGLSDRADRVANVLTAWQIRWDGDRPRLITAYLVSRVR